MKTEVTFAVSTIIFLPLFWFQVSMDPPIKQGQTRYPFLIIQFEKDEEFDVKLNLAE